MFIGILRAKLLMPFDCKWNAIVRDKTAEIEQDGNDVDELLALNMLFDYIKTSAKLDNQFNPEEMPRIIALFK